MIIKKEFKLMNKLINHIEKRIIKYKFKRKVYISIIDINKIDYKNNRNTKKEMGIIQKIFIFLGIIHKSYIIS